MNDSLSVYLLQICVMLAIALTFGKISQRLVHSTILGELLGGVVLGPTVLKAISPGMFTGLFPSKTVLMPETSSFIQLGMLIFMFTAGLEINLRIAWKKRKHVLFTSIFGMLIPLCFGMGLALCVLWRQGQSAGINKWIFSVFIGTALSISALPIILKTLIDLNILKTEIGTVIIGSATINDLAGWTIFTCLLNIMEAKGPIVLAIGVSVVKVAAFMLIMLMLGPKACRFIIKHLNRYLKKINAFIGMAVILILLIAFIAEKLNIHHFFAAFLLGTILSKYYRVGGAHIRVIMQKFVMELFAPLYFVSIGLKVNFICNFDVQLVLLVLLIACIGKIIGAGFGAFIGGMSNRAAMCVGFGMNSRGAVEIMIASTALELNLINEKIFVALVVMAIVTSLVSVLAIRKILESDRAIIQKAYKQEKEYSKT